MTKKEMAKEKDIEKWMHHILKDIHVSNNFNRACDKYM